MKKVFILFAILLFTGSTVFADDVILKNDNGNASLGGYSNVWLMEETKLLMPKGPCTVKEIQIYFAGTKPNKDTIYIVGDPAEGSISPTFWCLNYNMKLPPIFFNYSGKPGWHKFKVEGLHLDGLDRLVVQHRVQANGPWFAFDTDGCTSSPYTSYLMNPFQNNSLGGPGKFYLAAGDLMVRALVEYDLPDGDGSAPPPPPKMFDVTLRAGIVDGDGKMIKSNEVSVQDVNGDGWDDIVIASNLFINRKDGTFEYNNSLKKFSPSMTSWADFDNNGTLDFYSLRNGGWDANLNMVKSRDRIIKNLGNMQFQELPPSSSFNLPYPSPGKDFQMTNPYEQDSIFNPYSCITALWADYNSDGRLDLYLANNRRGFKVNGNYNERYFPDQLWKQQDNGTFINETKAAGIAAAEPYSKQNNSWYGYYDCYGANACDYNNDGKTDIFVANYRLVKDNLFKNNGNGTMTDVAPSTGVQGEPTASSVYFGHGMGAEWADFNNDGNMDLCVGNLGHPDWRGAVSNPSLIYKNDGPPNYHFTDVHKQMGLKFFEMNAGVLWADFDNDGFQDLWHGQISYVPQSATAPMRPGLLYMNQGPPDYKMKDMTWFYGCALHGPWSAARIDYDQDGDLDIIICSRFDGVRLFRNDLKKKGDWLAFRLKGNPAEQVPLNAFGTKLIVYVGNEMFVRELNSIAGTRMTQNSNELHFGIGDVSEKKTVDSVLVIYPNGKKNRIGNLAINKRYAIPYMGNPVTAKVGTPQLISPENFAVGLSENTTIKWQEITGIHNYFLEIYGDKELQTPTYSGKLSKTEFPIELSNGTYYWRVRQNINADTSGWSSIWNFTVGNLVPKAITLHSPKNNSNGILLKPQLSWNAAEYNTQYSPKTKYHLQISESADFSGTLIELKTIDDILISLNDLLKSNTKYYWHVRGNNKGTYGQWSDTWSFTTIELPSAPILLEPTNGASGIKNRPKMKWHEVENAENYHLQIANDEQFSDMFFDMKSLSTNSFKLFKKFKSGKKYYWRVCGVKNSYSGKWSDVWSFTAEKINSVDEQMPKLALITLSPNPMGAESTLSIIFEKRINARIVIYDELGRMIKKIDEKEFDAGEYKYQLNNQEFTSGIYFIKLIGNAEVQSFRFVVNK